MDTQTLSIEWVEIDRLFCSPSNPRHNEPAVPQVASSIRRFGWRQPIVARPSGEVIAGNTRLKAAKQLGHDKVPVAWFEGSDLDATAYAMDRDNSSPNAETITPRPRNMNVTLTAQPSPRRTPIWFTRIRR